VGPAGWPRTLPLSSGRGYRVIEDGPPAVLTRSCTNGLDSYGSSPAREVSKRLYRLTRRRLQPLACAECATSRKVQSEQISSALPLITTDEQTSRIGSSVPQAVAGDGDECAIRPQLRRICICDDGSITRATLPQSFVQRFGPSRIGRSQVVNPAVLSGSVRRRWVTFQPLADQCDMA